MYVVTVEFEVEKGAEAEFRAIALKQSVDSLEESGCTRFDVAVSDEEPQKYLFYEVYRDRAAFDAHLEMPYLAAFLKQVDKLTTERKLKTWVAAG